MPARLDHLVYAVPDLAAAVRRLTAAGLPLVPGGPHVGLGTRNALGGLGERRYLEVVGPDPEQPDPPAPRPFGLDEPTEPTLLTWAVAVSTLDSVRAAAAAVGHDPGPARSMQRRRPDDVLLSWRLAFPPDDAGGVLPFLIDWADSPHPSADLPAAELRAFTAETPEPDRVRRVLTALDVDPGALDLVAAAVPRLRARIAVDGGEVVL